LQALEEEFEKPYFRRLSEIIEVERSKFAVYPSVEEVWSWTTRAPIQDTRVVILGKAWGDTVVGIRVVIQGDVAIHK
jgi:uracil-DNA glycosylase